VTLFPGRKLGKPMTYSEPSGGLSTFGNHIRA